MDILKEKGVHTQLIKNVRYVYIDSPYWDKTKKQNRHNREYIGKLGIDGEFIPNRKYLKRQEEATKEEFVAKESQIAGRKFYGAIHLLNRMAESTGLEANLKQIFGTEKAAKLLSLAYFLVVDGESSMYRYEKFAKTHVTPYGKPIISQRISEIFASISENEKMKFFKLRAEKCLENEYLAYDTTSISSYSETMAQVKYGHNKDMESLPQINLAVVFGERSMLPVYYRKLPGNISDVSTIKKLLVDMSFLGLNKTSWVMDRGFYSVENINSLYRNRHKFVCAGRANSALVQDSIEKQRDIIRNYANYIPQYNIYGVTKKSKWKYEFIGKEGRKKSENRIIYIHTFYDGTRAEQEKALLIKRLKQAELAYLDGSCSDIQQKLLENFFDIDGQKITVKQSQIDAKVQNYGYFVLVSSHIDTAETALMIYRNKDVVEKTFCNLKNRLDMNRTKVSTEETLEGKLFVQFIALILVAYIHQVMLKNNLYKNYSIETLLDELDIIEIFEYQGKKSITSEITKKQRSLFALFGCDL